MFSSDEFSHLCYLSFFFDVSVVHTTTFIECLLLSTTNTKIKKKKKTLPKMRGYTVETLWGRKTTRRKTPRSNWNHYIISFILIKEKIHLVLLSSRSSVLQFHRFIDLIKNILGRKRLKSDDISAGSALWRPLDLWEFPTLFFNQRILESEHLFPPLTHLRFTLNEQSIVSFHRMSRFGNYSVSTDDVYILGANF